MKTIYAVLDEKTAEMTDNVNKDFIHKVLYDDDLMNKEIFIDFILMNAINMNAKTLIVFIKDKKIKQYTTLTISLDDVNFCEDNDAAFDSLNKSFSIKSGRISLED